MPGALIVYAGCVCAAATFASSTFQVEPGLLIGLFLLIPYAGLNLVVQMFIKWAAKAWFGRFLEGRRKCIYLIINAPAVLFLLLSILSLSSVARKHESFSVFKQLVADPVPASISFGPWQYYGGGIGERPICFFEFEARGGSGAIIPLLKGRQFIEWTNEVDPVSAGRVEDHFNGLTESKSFHLENYSLFYVKTNRVVSAFLVSSNGTKGYFLESDKAWMPPNQIDW